MDPKELKKLQEKLKKDQEALNKGNEALKKAQDVLLKAQGELVEDRKALDNEKERLGPLSEIKSADKVEADPKWLKGAVFVGRREGKPVKKPGKKTATRVFERVERPMTVADVLSFRVDGNEVIIVTADGQKLRVKK